MCPYQGDPRGLSALSAHESEGEGGSPPPGRGPRSELAQACPSSPQTWEAPSFAVEKPPSLGSSVIAPELRQPSHARLNKLPVIGLFVSEQTPRGQACFSAPLSAVSWAPGVVTGSQNTLRRHSLGGECPPRAPLPPTEGPADSGLDFGVGSATVALRQLEDVSMVSTSTRVASVYQCPGQSGVCFSGWYVLCLEDTIRLPVNRKQRGVEIRRHFMPWRIPCDPCGQVRGQSSARVAWPVKCPPNTHLFL